MSKELLIVFVKNIKLGKVKTRLAKTIGDEAAFEVYKELVEITENATQQLDRETYIYFSDVIIDSKWPECKKYIQEGIDLGIKMKNAFLDGFRLGYEKIVLIGSDLPNINSSILNRSFDELSKEDVVFGPAEDGGYYLIGLNKPLEFVFDEMPWSESNLLEQTISKLNTERIGYSLLETLNDVDTYEDMVACGLFKKYEKIILKEF